VVSRDNERRRVPTSDELEQAGALRPAVGATGPQRRAGLKRFFASRFRVSDDVAARKHVAGVQPSRPAGKTSEVTEDADHLPADVGSSPPQDEKLAVPDQQRPPDAIVPRKIRISPSVREQRGLGRPPASPEGGRSTLRTAMSDPIELGTGDVFGDRYEIQRLLGEGDRKKTYLAADTKLDRPVALSFVKPNAVLADPEGTKREAKVLGHIGRHDNIVSLFDYEVSLDGSVQYMVFEYLSGGTLADHLAQAGPLPADDLLRLGRQLSRGLAHLHDGGLIHRDVSPDNVWLDQRGKAHIGDFDSAVTIGSDAGALPITTGSFASPEEHAGAAIDIRSDLYSLGLVLHVAATGARYSGDLLLLSQRTDVPSAFGDLLASLLADSPADRPDNADAVRAQLDFVRSASNISALIANGESDELEFKSSLHHPYGPLPGDLQARVDQGKLTETQAQQEVRKRLNKAVTKTLAAFLNSSGGTLLIGVEDSGDVLGIAADFPYLRKDRQSSDEWLLSIRDVIGNALGPEVWEAIHVSLVRHEDAVVGVLQCPRRNSETWQREDNGQHFYIRASSASHELTGASLVTYVRDHWPK
jgi:serine/threonine protein kinase